MSRERSGRKRATVTVCALVLVAVIAMMIPSGAAAVPPPYVIVDDTAGANTGGDCTLIGTWDGNSLKCTLNQDIGPMTASGAIQIDSGNIILDGAGHTITGDDSNIGIFINSVSNVLVQNVNVADFFAGVEIFGGSSNTVSDSSLSSNFYGLFALNGSLFNSVSRNRVTGNSVGIQLSVSHFNLLAENTVTDGNTGIESDGGVSNVVRFNHIDHNQGNGIYLYNGAHGNVVSGNSVSRNVNGLGIYSSSNEQVYNNHFLQIPGSNQAHLVVGGTSTGNIMNKPLPVGGNYWGGFSDTPACVNADNDAFCDTAFTSMYAPSDPDNLPLAERRYYFTWYDQLSPGVLNWVLMTNPIDPAAVTDGDGNAWFDLAIGGSGQTLPASTPEGLPGQVVPLGGITPSFPGFRDGPVTVDYHARMQQMVSQRTLWGDSLEEVVATDAAQLSDHYYWTWYDQQSPGYTNWVMLSNPDPDNPVRVEILIGGDPMNDPQNPGNSYFDIPAGGRVTPSFPGEMGGPVEVRAYTPGGAWPANAKDVIASQRVLTNYGKAFNEVPGIPADLLSSDYYWTWYDSVGGSNWVMLANQTATDPVYYRASVAGGCDAPDPDTRAERCREGGIAAGETLPLQFTELANGPVRVQSWSDSVGGSNPIAIVASQRSLWGPSFEEVPGYAAGLLARIYHWTWYDQQSPGSLNWIMVSNPNLSPPTMVTFDIYVGDTKTSASEFIYPGDIKYYVYPGTMNGPVRVIGDNKLIVSQRVLWKGHFNEVMGTPLS